MIIRFAEIAKKIHYSDDDPYLEQKNP